MSFETVDEQRFARELFLLTSKPVLYVCNVDDASACLSLLESAGDTALDRFKVFELKFEIDKSTMLRSLPATPMWRLCARPSRTRALACSWLPPLPRAR